jgi:hypothetical protein
MVHNLVQLVRDGDGLYALSLCFSGILGIIEPILLFLGSFLATRSFA